MFNLGDLFSADDTDYQSILEEMTTGKAQLVDIRERSEWKYFRFEGAVNIPLSRLAKGQDIEQLKEIKDAGKTIYLHCHTGSRVQMAKQLLREFGCSEFKILTTTMHDLARQGFKMAA